VSKRKKVNLTVQPSDNLRLAISISDERLADFLRAVRRLRRAIRWAGKVKRAK